MSAFWQVFFGVIAAWLAIQIVLQPMLRRLTNAVERGERLKAAGYEAFARAVVDELQKREER